MKTHDWLGAAIHFFDLHYGHFRPTMGKVCVIVFLDRFCSISSGLNSNGTITKCVETHLHTACGNILSSFQANIHQKLKGR